LRWIKSAYCLASPSAGALDLHQGKAAAEKTKKFTKRHIATGRGSCFDRARSINPLSLQRGCERALVEIEGLTFGGRMQARCLPLIGITYDFRDDILEIAMEGIDHLIHHRREILVSEGAEGLERLDVIDSARQKQDVRLVKPLRYAHRAAKADSEAAHVSFWSAPVSV
jgi:hypothetical protein